MTSLPSCRGFFYCHLASVKLPQIPECMMRWMMWSARSLLAPVSYSSDETGILHTTVTPFNLSDQKQNTNNVVRLYTGCFFIGPRYTWGPIYGSECLKLTEGGCADLTDVTLADEDTNSILTDNANRVIQGNVAMQITQSGCQLWN